MSEYNLTFAEVVENLEVGQMAEGSNGDVIRKTEDGDIVLILDLEIGDETELVLYSGVLEASWKIFKEDKLQKIEGKMKELHEMVKDYVYSVSGLHSQQERATQVMERTAKYMMFYGR